MKIAYKKIISVFTAVLYLFTATPLSYGASENTVELLGGQPVPVKSVSANETETFPDLSSEAEDLSSTGFLSENPLSPSENEPLDLERADFEYAVELLREDLAAAVIVKTLTKENLESLQALPFETAVVVLHGEIVLFSTGNEEEIGVTPAAKKLLDEASFIAHTHIADGAQDGPSSFDLSHAAAGGEYVLTANGVYAYDANGLLNDGQPQTLEAFLAALHSAQNQAVVDAVKAREALNAFIAEMDRYNEAAPEEREIYRKDQALLNSITASINSGATHTNNANITISITVGNPIPQGEQLQMAFSQDGTIFSAFENLSSTKALTLMGSDGSKNITVRFKDSANNIRNVLLDIVLDKTKPVFLNEYQLIPTVFEDEGNRANGFGNAFARIANHLVISDLTRKDSNVDGAGVVEMFDSSHQVLHIFHNPDPNKYLYFGRQVVNIENKYLAISAAGQLEYWGGATLKPGAVFIFDADPSSLNFGKLISTIEDPLNDQWNGFGIAVHYDKDLLYVGAPQTSLGANGQAGKVYIYSLNSETGIVNGLLKTIDPPVNTYLQRFGAILKTYSGELAVGTDSIEPGKGGVYFYNINPASSSFGSRTRSIVAPSDAIAFGSAFDFFNGNILVGAPKTKKTNTSLYEVGRVYLINSNFSDVNFGQIISIYDPFLNTTAHTRFGDTIAIHSNKAIVSSEGYWPADTKSKVSIIDLALGAGSILQVLDIGIGKSPSLFIETDAVLVGHPKQDSNDGIVYSLKFQPKTKGFLINQDKAYANALSVDLLIEVEDVITDAQKLQMSFSEDNVNYTSYEPLKRNSTFLLQNSGSPSRTIFGRVKDLAGNVFEFQDTITVDLAVPTGSIKINNDAVFTTSQNVTLSLSASDDISGISGMRFSFDGGLSWTNWEAFSGSKSVILPWPDGVKEVWFQLRDLAENITLLKDSIKLDRQAPSGEIYVKESINTPDVWALVNKSQLTFEFNINDSISSQQNLQFSYSIDSLTSFTAFEPFSSQKVLSLPSKTSPYYTVYFKFRDEAGNVSSAIPKDIVIDTQAPTGSVLINNNAQFTLDPNVNLQISGTDSSGVKEMRFSIDGGMTWSVWENFKTPKSITLPNRFGESTVRMQLKDVFGYTAEFSDEIFYLESTTSGDLSYLSQGLYQLTLDQDFKNYLARVMPASLASTLSTDEKVSVEINAMKEYARLHLADVYDFLVFLPTQKAFTDNLPFYTQNYLNQVLGLGWAEVDNIDGIGTPQATADQIARMAPFEALFRQEMGPVLSELRENGTHQGSAMVDVQAALNDVPENKYVDNILLQELAHRWLAFLSSNGQFNSNPLGILGRDNSHWSMFFDADLSPMDGFNWKDNGDGTFSLTHIQGIKVDDIVAYGQGLRSTLPVSYEFNDFDLYAMGLVDKSAVKSSFVIDNPRMLDGRSLNEDNFFDIAFNDFSFLFGTHTIRGTKRSVAIQDVIKVEGERDPVFANSQKNFNIAFIYVKDDSQDSSQNSSTQAQNRWKDTIDDIWSVATRGLSTMSLGFSNAGFTVFQNKVLGLFEDAVSGGSQDGTEVEKAEDNLSTLGDMDTLISQIEALIATLQSQVNQNSLIPSFIGSIPADIATLKIQIQNFRTQLEDALEDAADSEAFIDGKRTSLTQLILQSAITGLLPAGFGSSVDAILQSVKGLFTGVATANNAFGGSSASMLSQLNAYKTKLQGPVTGHKFEVLGNPKSVEVNDETLGEYDGSGDSIVVENSEDWNFGTGDFTVDFRLKMDTHATEKYLFQIGSGLYFSWHPVNGGRLDLIAGGAVISTNYKNDSQWHHFAVVRSGGVLKLYVDGQQKDAGVNANKSIGSGKFTIGSENSGIMSVDGFFDDFRVVKGAALWTSNFTPPEDVERDENTKLLLNFTPEEFDAKAEVGTSTGPKPIKGTAVILNGNTHTTTTAVTLNLTSSAGAPPIQMAFSLDGGSTYTSYEAFSTTKNLTLTGSDGNKEIRIRYKDSADQTLDLSDTIILDRALPTGSVSINNGAASVSTAEVTLTLDADDALTTDANLQMSVSVDGTNFSAYESFKTTKTVTLAGESGVKTVTVRYKDEAGNVRTVTDTIQYNKPAVVFTGKTFTLNGNTAVTNSQSVFGGSSGEFDGAGDSITVQDSPDWNLGTGDFTIDFRLKMDTHSTEKYLFQIGNGLYLSWHPVNGGRLDLIAAGAVISTAYARDANWHHFAVVRSGGILKLYVDGAQKDLGVNANKSIPAGKFTIGAENSGIMSVDGFFDEFRVSNNARWTSNFTPPTGELDRDDNTKFLLHFTADEFTNKTEVGGPKPVAGTAAIASGNAYTTSPSITLNLTATGGTEPYQMAFSLDGGSTYTSYETFAATKNLTLTGADGTKEVRVRIKDTDNQVFETSDTIILDRAQPTGSVSINSGAVKTTTTSVTLTLDADDAITADANLQMSISVDGTNFSAYEAFNATKNVTLTGSNGTNTVTVRYKDQAGHVREVTDTITLETPMSGSVAIAGGQTYTTTTAVTLTLAASGGAGSFQMQFSQDGGTTYTTYETFGTSKSLTLTGADGTKEVRVRIKDGLGQTIEQTDTIILDRALPTGSVSVNNGAAKTSSTSVTLTLDADDAITSDANLQMSISVDGTNFSAYETFASTKSVTLAGDSGVKTVTVRYKDQAGNVREVTDTIQYDKPAVVFTGKTFTVNGNTAAVEKDSVFGGSSAEFDGAGDSLTVQDSPDWNLGTSDFTVDFRLKMETHSTEKYLFQIGNGLYLSWHPVNGGRLDLIAGGGVVSTNYKNDGAWHHFAVVRSGGVLKLYVDGAQKDVAVNANKSIPAGKFTIGAENSGIMSVDGFFDEFRVSNNARWTSNFTPPSSEHERDDNTKFLLHFTADEFANLKEAEGPAAPKPVAGTAAIANGNAFTASTSVTLNLTATGGTSPYQMAFSQDGGTTYTSYETFASTKNLTLTGADGNKEVRVRLKDSLNEVFETSDTIILDRTQPTGSVSVNSGAAKTTSASVTLTLDAEDALTADANLQMSISVDGTTFSAYESFKTSKSVTLAGDSGIKTVTVRYKDQAGNIREVTDTIEYEKPAVVFTGHNFTAGGNASATTADSVFGGSSGEFDGAGDSIAVQNSPDWNFGTGDFTVDFRLKMDTHGGEKYLFQIGNGLYLTWHPVNGGRLDLIAGGGGESVPLKPVLGQWVHFAIVRQNGVIKLFVNGAQVGADTPAPKPINGGKFTIGSENSGIMSVDGGIDEFRVSNTARWTSNFTPASSEYTRDANTLFLLHFTAAEFAAGSETE